MDPGKTTVSIVGQTAPTPQRRDALENLAAAPASARYRYKRALKVQWLACVLVCAVYIALAIVTSYIAIAHFHGWVSVVELALGLLVLKYVIAAGLFVARRWFVWSEYRVEGVRLVQRSPWPGARASAVDLAQPHSVSYHFLFREAQALTLPYYQCLVLRQGGQTVRILPCHIMPGIAPGALPESVRAVWSSYDGRHPWLVLPPWIARAASLCQRRPAA